jgi:hypothetical protein
MERGEVRGTAGRRGIKEGGQGGDPLLAIITHYSTFLRFVKWYLVSGLSSER